MHVKVPRRWVVITASKSSSDIFQSAVAQDAGVVDQHVEPAELLDGAVDQRLGSFAGTHGDDLGDGGATGVGDGCHGVLGDVGVDVVDHDRRTGRASSVA